MAASLIKISDGYYSNAELEKLLTEERIVPEMSFTRCAQFLARDLLNARRERDAALKSIRDMQDAENLRNRGEPKPLRCATCSEVTIHRLLQCCTACSE